MFTDSELINAFVKNNDNAAFNHIIERYRNLVWNIAFRFTGNFEDSQDILQDTFIRLMDAAPGYKPSASLGTFIYRIVTNLCLDLKKKKRPEAADDIDNRENFAPAITPEESIDLKKRAAIISEGLRALPARQRLAIIYKYDHSLSTQETAEIMKTSEKAVERLLAHGREGLKSFLEKSELISGDFK